jgi:hypothetical protein
LITGAALVLGSSVILFDPIFQGMAVSLMFGVIVSTALTLIVIPLGCVTARTAMCATMNKGLTDSPSCATTIGLSSVSDVSNDHQTKPTDLSAQIVSDDKVIQEPSEQKVLVEAAPTCLPLALFKQQSITLTHSEVEVAPKQVTSEQEVVIEPVIETVASLDTKTDEVKVDGPVLTEVEVESIAPIAKSGLSKRPRRGIKIKETES